MSEPIDRSRSLREQVEEYKRQQRALEQGRLDNGEAAEPDGTDREGYEPEDWTEEEKRDFAELERMSREPATGGPDVGRIVGAVFLGVGALLLLVTAALFWHTRQSLAAEVVAPGVVVKNVLRHVASSPDDSSRSAGSSDLYHAVVEFRVADGTLKTVEMSEGNWPKAWEEGERVTVRYDPQKPLRARVGGGGLMDFFAALVTGFLGVLFTAIAIGVRTALGQGSG